MFKREAFRDWLKSLSPRTRFARRLPCGCPLARFARATFPDASVGIDRWRSSPEHSPKMLPPWAQELRAVVDKDKTRRFVSPAEVLKLL